MKDSKVGSLKEGFREPPDRVTEPCLTYMARIMEMRKFVAFYFNFVKTSHELASLIPVEVQRVSGEKQLEVLRYNYSQQQPFMNQIMLSRSVESFDLYLTTILRDIFLSRPEMLKSAGTIDVSVVIEAGNYEDLIWEIVNRKVHELSYKPLSELRKFIESRTGIDLFPSKDAFEATIIASEIRNLIAHNDCVISELFTSRTNGISMPLPVSDTGRITIEDEWLRRASYTLDGMVFRFDELTAEKFGLSTLNRMSSFLYRG